jgi:hypothetical protein
MSASDGRKLPAWRRAKKAHTAEEKTIAPFVNQVKSARPALPPGKTEKVLLDRRDQIREWLEKGLPLLDRTARTSSEG